NNHRSRRRPVAAGLLLTTALLVFALPAGCAKRTVTAAPQAPPWIDCVAFRPDGKVLATVADQVVKLWDVDTGKERSSFRGHTNAITGLVFSPDGKNLVTASYDQTLILWDAATGKPERTLKGHRVALTAVAFSPDGKMIASGAAHPSPFN